MQKINKTLPPDFFVRAKNRVACPNVGEAWNDENIVRVKTQLRKHILENEQNCLCAYCEIKVACDSSSSIDHFRKKASDFFPRKTLDYNNLLVTCKTSGRCEAYKDSNIQKEDYKKLINPVKEDPEKFFGYLPTGEIFIKEENLTAADIEKAKFTRDIFKLDDVALQIRRRTVASRIIDYCGQITLEEFQEYFPDFKTFTSAVFEKLNVQN